MKHYLTGMDWIVQGLNAGSRKRGGGGHVFQIVLELAREPSAKRLKETLVRYCRRFALLTARPARAWNLAPYWRRFCSETSHEMPFRVQSAAGKEDAVRILSDDFLCPFEFPAFPVRVCGVRTPETFFLGFTFDHRFFDARGAEFFLQGYQESLSLPENTASNEMPEPSHLDHWKRKFAAGKKINRLRIAGKNAGRVLHLKDVSKGQKPEQRFKTVLFDGAETQAIEERVQEIAGPFMFLPYSLAICLRAFQDLLRSRGETEGQFVVPVTRDLRGRQKKILFNQFSFLFFSAGSHELADRDVLIASLRHQLYRHVAEKSAEALAEAAMLARIVPLWKLTGALEKNPPSFSFAVLGESGYSSPEFLGSEIKNMFHLPAVPPAPGIGVFFSHYKKRLNMTLSYQTHLLSEADAEHLFSAMRRL